MQNLDIFNRRKVGASEYGEVDFFNSSRENNKTLNNVFIYQLPEEMDEEGLDRLCVAALYLKTEAGCVGIGTKRDVERPLTDLVNEAFEELGAKRTVFSNIFKEFNGRQVPEGLKATLSQQGLWHDFPKSVIPSPSKSSDLAEYPFDYRPSWLIPVEIKKTFFGGYKIIPSGGPYCDNPLDKGSHYKPDLPHETHEPS
ncbi:MAG: hypothetical protein WBK77_09245 [Alphaproteobacteria bacterium]